MKLIRSAFVLATLISIAMTVVALASWDDCKTISCCDSEYDAGVTACNFLYGPRYSPSGEFINPGSPIALEGCVSGKKLVLTACLDKLKKLEEGNDPKANIIHINGGSVILAVNPMGQVAHRYVYRAVVPAGMGGRYVLHSRNGVPDPNPHSAHHRVRGSVLINGHPVLDSALLNDELYANDIAVTLNDGANTIEFELHFADGDGAFGFVTAWLDNLS